MSWVESVAKKGDKRSRRRKREQYTNQSEEALVKRLRKWKILIQMDDSAIQCEHRRKLTTFFY